jgi:transcriptional regulator with XRE-family HTH domain
MTEIAIDVLAERLRAKRAGRGVREVARDIGISPATYSRVENNNLPDLETFTKLCEWVGIDPNEVLGVKSASDTSAPRVLVHFKNENVMPKELAAAMGEMILKAQKAMIEEKF